MFIVTFGAFTVRRGMPAPTGRVMVRVALLEICSVAVPPSKVDAMLTALCASIVPVPALFDINPSVSVKVPGTTIVLVLLNSKL